MSPGHRTAASRFNAVNGVAVKARCLCPVDRPTAMSVEVSVADLLQNIPAGTAGERHK